MKIYVVEAGMELYEELYNKNGTGTPRQNRNNPDIINGLNPKVYWTVKEYEVLEERDDLYVRKNDGSYEEIFTHKVYEEHKEYDYEDEVLNRPIFPTLGNYEFEVRIPTTKDGIENAKKIITQHIERYIELETLRANKMLEALKTKENWITYNPHYEWKEE